MKARFTAYLVAHFGKSLLWTGSDLLTIYVLVNVHEMAPAAAGSIFLFGLFINAAADWAFGSLLARRPDLTQVIAMGGLIVASATFPASMWFSFGKGWSTFAIPILATASFRIAYAAYDVPHNALIARLSTTVSEASGLARGRTMGTGLAALALGLGLNWSITLGNTAVMMGIVACTTLGLAAAAIPLMALRPHERSEEPSLGLANSHMPWRFIVAVLLFDVGVGTIAKGLLHMPADCAPPQAGTTVMLLTFGRMASSFYPSRGREGAKGLNDLALICAVTGVGVVTFALAYNALMIFLLGLAMGVANLNNWTLLAQFSRNPAMFGVFAMGSKIALGLAGFVMSTILGSEARFDETGLCWLVATASACCLGAGLIVGFRQSLPLTSSNCDTAADERT